MDIKECEVLEIELKKNTEILENTFERLNLKALSVAYSGNTRDEGLRIWIELTTIDGARIKVPRNSCSAGAEIKLNFYENDNLLCSISETVYKDLFCGYDTVEIHLTFPNILSRTTSVRLFATVAP